jgi:hypothetical protein
VSRFKCALLPLVYRGNPRADKACGVRFGGGVIRRSVTDFNHGAIVGTDPNSCAITSLLANAAFSADEPLVKMGNSRVWPLPEMYCHDAS